MLLQQWSHILVVLNDYSLSHDCDLFLIPHPFSVLRNFMKIYEAVVMFLPCMQTSMSWEATLSSGILKSFLSHWVCLVYIWANFIVKQILKVEISRIPLIWIQHLKKLETCFCSFQNLFFKELSLSLWKSV